MGLLHELLAAEKTVMMQQKQIDDETKNIFGKPDTFVEVNKTLQMYDEERQIEAAEAEEHREMVTTVISKLKYHGEITSRLFDLMFQKECSNQLATADLTIKDENVVIETDVPATFLLSMEHMLIKLRDTFQKSPTLPQTVEWEEDRESGEGIWKAKYDEKRSKTEKTFKGIILSPATDKHPAQVKEVSVDKPIGTFITKKRAGMLTPRQKYNLLNRLDKLIISVKEARMRANCTQVVSKTIGQKIFEYLFSGFEE